jgi:hypothetical protein
MSGREENIALARKISENIIFLNHLALPGGMTTSKGEGLCQTACQAAC